MTMLIGLDEVKTFLKITSSNDDEPLADIIESASAVAEYYCGDLSPQAYTESHDGGDTAIYVRHTPLVSVTSLTEYIGSITYTLTNQPLGQSVNAWGYTIDDPQAGRIVRRSASGFVWRFAPGVGNVSVTYTTGLANIPPQIYTGIEMVIRHLWQTRRGAMPIPANQETESVIPGLGYAVPDRAIELFETAPRNPVIG